MNIRCGKDLRILIVGAGVAGLTLGALLSQRGWKPRIIERAKQRRSGYILELSPAGSRVLKGLGLFQAFLDSAERIERHDVADSRGRLLSSTDYQPYEERFGPFAMVGRNELVELLRSGLAEVEIETGVYPLEIRQDQDRATVFFHDNSRADFDLVVGADGLNSTVRKLAITPEPLRESHLVGWALWTDQDLAEPGVLTEYWGGDRFLVLCRAHGRACCALGVADRKNPRDPTPDSAVERLRREFRHFGGKMPAILERLDKSGVIWHDKLKDVRPAKWSEGRVVLLGDAVHPILPVGGVGASMAMESAAVLADELLRTDAKLLPRTLEFFEQRRRRRVEEAQEYSRDLARVMTGEKRLHHLSDADLWLKILTAPI